MTVLAQARKSPGRSLKEIEMSRIFRRLMHDGPGVTGIEFTLITVLIVLLSISTMSVVSTKYAHAAATAAAVLA